MYFKALKCICLWQSWQESSLTLLWPLLVLTQGGLPVMGSLHLSVRTQPRLPLTAACPSGCWLEGRMKIRVASVVLLLRGRTVLRALS